MIKRTPIIHKDQILFSDSSFTIIAGPCAVEDEDSLRKTANFLSENGIKMLRGGVNKLRTSPYAFQGLGREAVYLLSKVAKEYNLLSVAEITSESEIDFLTEYIDILVVGTRNMFNYRLLKELGKLRKPIILKRGMSATIQEWTYAAEYILLQGNENIILCERGIRTFEDTTRYTFDLAAAVYVLQNFPYYIITDPSHGTGIRSLVLPMAEASRAVSLHGVMIEIHPNPEISKCDAEQMLNFNDFVKLLSK